MAVELTENQNIFLELLKSQYHKAPLPSMRQVAEDLNYKYHNSVQHFIETLMFKGLVQKVDNFLYLDKKLFAMKIFDSRVPAGIPEEQTDDSHEMFDFDDYMNTDNERCFILRVSGDSMEGAGIFDGDLITVDKKIHPTHGVIVVALIDGGYTVKYLKRKNGLYYLKAANPKYTDIYPEQDFKVIGVVTGSVRKF